jgi:hypothetical protein
MYSVQVSTEKERERALLQVLHREVDRLEEERIQLKTDNRNCYSTYQNIQKWWPQQKC